MAKRKVSNKIVNKKVKPIKKERIIKKPIHNSSIWHIVIGILALIAIIIIIILAIPKESSPQVVPVTPEDALGTDTTTEVPITVQPPSSAVPDDDANTNAGGGSNGGSSGSGSDEEDELTETGSKCANWFGNNLNWEEITVATQIGNSGPWGLMKNDECTEAIIGDQGIYSCAVSFEEGGFAPCAGDCKDGNCLSCTDCEETTGEYSCADTIDNDGDGTVDCADEDCNEQLCDQNSYCSDGGCVEEAEGCSYVDTDGGNNHFVQGTCDDGKAIIYTDHCQDENILIEYWLGEGDACYEGCQGGSTLFYCPSLGNGWSCNNGACVLAEGNCEFTDDDGGIDLEVKGICDDGKAFINTDSCSNYITLTEYNLDIENPCVEGCTSNEYTCPVLCEDGACVEETTVASNSFCSDYCKFQKAASYKTGLCLAYNDQGAMSKENACANIGPFTYESNSEGKCHVNNICCCVAGIQ